MRNDNLYALVAYLSTLAAIVLLTVAAALIVNAFNGGDTQLAKVIGALAFIGAAVTGLIGVIGTFRPRGGDSERSVQADANLATALDKLPPATTGTGPARPVGEVDPMQSEE